MLGLEIVIIAVLVSYLDFEPSAHSPSTSKPISPTHTAAQLPKRKSAEPPVPPKKIEVPQKSKNPEETTVSISLCLIIAIKLIQATIGRSQ